MDVLKNKKIYFVLAGTLLFNYLFWQSPIGINALLFTIFALISLLILYPDSRKPGTASAAMLGHFITALFVVIHNSGVAILGWHITFILMVGFANQPTLRSILFALPTSITNFFKFPLAMKKEIPKSNVKLPKVKSGWRYIKLSLLPLFILWVFFLIFKFANPIFDDYSTTFFIYIIEILEKLFENFSIVRILFILFGFSLSGWIVYKFDVIHFIKKESQLSDFIKRIHKVRKPEMHSVDNSEYPAPHKLTIGKSKMNLGLKSEYRSAILLIFMVNLLLLIVNGIDINWIWFNFEYEPGFDLKQFVHEGTYLLILSILLSMYILLYFFRRNMNFYPNPKLLKTLSYVWLVQNCILAISVGMRNFHYINHYGLAYKRIGVIVFLLLTIFGLITLFIKIKDRKSAFYLLRVNTWSVYLTLILLGTINWDVVIAKHNLAHNYESPVDVRFLLSLSDKTLPLIERGSIYLDINEHSRYYNKGVPFSYHDYFENRKEKFLKRKENETWTSWNLAEQRAYEYFSKTSSQK
ncbi:MAG: DUF4173 domain-containing protein [Bacteroidales bacterium]|nr:DUF4173 domain-containing protein [Bacteroidales bacterium]MCF8455833.1 DUF4173 domain-containing protein [Bacteroidales bacterium]